MNKLLKVYIAGKITYDPNFEQKFAHAERMLLARGFLPMNPARLSTGFAHADYMHICLPMIEVCNAVLFLEDWKESEGAKKEHAHATALSATGLMKLCYSIDDLEDFRQDFNNL